MAHLRRKRLSINSQINITLGHIRHRPIFTIRAVLRDRVNNIVLRHLTNNANIARRVASGTIHLARVRLSPNNKYFNYPANNRAIVNAPNGIIIIANGSILFRHGVLRVGRLRQLGKDRIGTLRLVINARRTGNVTNDVHANMRRRTGTLINTREDRIYRVRTRPKRLVPIVRPLLRTRVLTLTIHTNVRLYRTKVCVRTLVRVK